MAFASLLAALLFQSTVGVPLTNQRTFGHSVKNGPLPAHTEVTTFEHNCSTAPCVITQIHVPSIYPPHGEAWNWTHGILNFYVDGETTPSITMTLLELAGESRFNNASDNAQTGNPGGTTDGGPWGIDMMGRTAKSGGVFSTVRIPFGTSIKTTIQAPPSSMGQSVYWMIVRGLESHPVVLGDLTLPAAARLKIYRLPQTDLVNLELVTLANVSDDKSGALLRVNFDAKGHGFGYLEACMRLVTDGATTPLFLSSGAEDYFLSASYFDEGMFKTPNSGLTFFDHSGIVGAYKTHTIDPVLFHNGMQLIFRRCEATSGCGSMAQCPNQYCPPNSPTTPGFKSYDFNETMLTESLKKRSRELGAVESQTDTVVTYNTLVWTYEWDNAAADVEAAAREDATTSTTPAITALTVIATLADANLITDAEENSLVDLVLKQDTTLISLINGFQHPQHQQSLLRQIKRLFVLA
eukprot:m.112895 g.112895  ORF g.112895 m.112895 type:complete len:466 (+) comp28226_c0_seq1:152-1549(+)